MSNKVYQRNLPFGRKTLGKRNTLGHSSRLSFGNKSGSRFSLKTISSITSRKSFAYAFSVFAIAFVASILSFSILAPADSSNALNTVTANIVANDYYLSVTSHDVDMELSSLPVGSYGQAYDTITTKTNAPGYKLYVSSTNSADFAADKPGNALYKNGDTTITPFISPTSGTFSTPAPLAMNTWGVSNTETITGQEDTFFAMPLLNAPQLIQTTTSANETGIDKRLDFGIRADSTMPVGSYSSTIVYTATANANTSGNNLISISPDNAESLAGGETITITTSLYTNYNLGTGDVNVTIGGRTCAITAVTTDVSTGVKQITCTTPAQASWGAKDVVVRILPFEWSSTSQSGYVMYPKFFQISTMQEMTATVCNSVYTPSNVTGDNATIATKDIYTATADGTSQVPSTTLKDTRDNKTYTVRKLADGNCWMTENLSLALTANQPVQVAKNSDGTSAGTWTPTSTTGDGSATAAINRNTQVSGGYYLYSWWAATAGSTQTTRYADADDSICPVGWRLPPYQDSKSYKTLVDNYSYTATALMSNPINFVSSGFCYDGSCYRAYSDLWTSAAAGSSTSYYFDIRGEYEVSPQKTDYKNRGFAIRCVNASN